MLPLGALAQTVRLNDTGQITCYNATAVTGTVSAATPDPETAGFDEQDCTRGAAAADALGVVLKIGASTAPGRDYTKIANDGSVLPASATLGSNPGDWACTRDNITGLIWEIKTNDAASLRHRDHTYDWYDTDATINGGNAGTIGTNTCNATLPASQCNTTAFRNAVNVLAGSNRLCGATDWRLPTDHELQSLVHHGAPAAPLIDGSYFPNTISNFYWSGTSYAPLASNAWGVFFDDGLLTALFKPDSQRVRLVRGGQ